MTVRHIGSEIIRKGILIPIINIRIDLLMKTVWFLRFYTRIALPKR